MLLVATLNGRRQRVALVDEYIVSTAMRVTVHQECGLVTSVYAPVRRYVLHCTAQARKRRVEIGHVDDVTDQLSFLDGTWPPGECGNAHTTLGEVALATSKHQFRHSPSCRWVVDHGAIVGHRDEECVLRDLQILQGLKGLL